jgi:shikimate dehydrogenase
MMSAHVHSLADLRQWAANPGQTPWRLAVLGDPVAHSASPPMHNAALAARGIDARYTRLHVRPGELAEALSLLAPARFIGVNVTIPHKTEVLALLGAGAVDAHATLLGAVNTVRVEPGGSLHGFNTDGPGFVRAVRAEFGRELSGLRVLILGAGGGAGRALAAQCVIEGTSRLMLANRTPDKAQALAGELASRQPGTHVAAVAWASVGDAAADADLIVNATSVGLDGGAQSPVSEEALRRTRPLVFDTVYRADGSLTPLLEAAARAGAQAAGGRALLLWQGALSFVHWFGEPSPVNQMRAALG